MGGEIINNQIDKTMDHQWIEIKELHRHELHTEEGIFRTSEIQHAPHTFDGKVFLPKSYHVYLNDNFLGSGVDLKAAKELAERHYKYRRTQVREPRGRGYWVDIKVPPALIDANKDGDILWGRIDENGIIFTELNKFDNPMEESTHWTYVPCIPKPQLTEKE